MDGAGDTFFLFLGGNERQKIYHCVNKEIEKGGIQDLEETVVVRYVACDACGLRFLTHSVSDMNNFKTVSSCRYSRL